MLNNLNVEKELFINNFLLNISNFKRVMLWGLSESAFEAIKFFNKHNIKVDKRKFINGSLIEHKYEIFGDFKITCALHSFIKKCNNEVTKEVYTFDKKLYTDKVINLDFSAIMDSKTALDKAINNIIALVGIQATYKKKYNDGLKHFATKQRINGKGITMSDTSIYDLMDYTHHYFQDLLS